MTDVFTVYVETISVFETCIHVSTCCTYVKQTVTLKDSMT